MLQSAVGSESRLQVCLFSATLHSPEITKLSERICQLPTWVDLKGKDAVPETVYHLVIPVDAAADLSWTGARTDVRPAVSLDHRRGSQR